MKTKKDITNKEDIEQLVLRFYQKIKADEIIAHHFSDVDWQKHLPIMFKFWENTIFYTGDYSGNPMQTHRDSHAKNKFTEEDFKIWIAHFTTTLDELFEGDKTELARQRAISIATVLRIKLLH